MAYEQNLQSYSAPAAADLSAYQYRFIVLDSTGSMALAGAGARCDGVLQDKPEAGRVGCYAPGGTAMVVAGAPIPAGTRVMSDNQGRAVPYVAADQVFPAGKTKNVAALAVGDVVPVMLEMN